MESNKRFSIEYIFNLVEIQRHAVGVSYMPDTKSYEKYENGFTVLHVLSMDLKTALHNMKNRFPNRKQAGCKNPGYQDAQNDI